MLTNIIVLNVYKCGVMYFTEIVFLVHLSKILICFFLCFFLQWVGQFFGQCYFQVSQVYFIRFNHSLSKFDHFWLYVCSGLKKKNGVCRTLSQFYTKMTKFYSSMNKLVRFYYGHRTLYDINSWIMLKFKVASLKTSRRGNTK